ncbi:molybdopterin-dependent oxidoreductase [Alteromonas sp. LMIT006]|uniref:nitrate reductase n=1 Tax=Alteromonadaceae TaxID=72275 RepID=UPI0020CA48C5|nr:nitrate reductase [Alteromonas sp. LMIT006]UTP73227.1 molybdopterin-dependent oxidoreductase [Alteromonas sp. LMIT006]
MKTHFKQSVECTTCPYCGVGCGVDATVINDKITAVKGTQHHPANHGKLCVKGTHLADTVGRDGRLLNAVVDGEPVSNELASAAVAERFNQIIQEHGPDAVAFYVSGQILTEDYYVANKLMKGYIGSANIDTNSRLCMSSAVAAYKRSFGSDTVPTCYEDIDLTQMLVLVGSNAAWTHPILFQRMQQAKANNPSFKIVIIDPRESATCDIADLHLPIKPGSDIALFNGLLNFIIENGAVDDVFVAHHTEQFTQAAVSASAYSLAEVSAICGVSQKAIRQFYLWFVEAPSALSFYSQGVNQSVQGVDKCNAIINCHLAIGQIGKPGAGPFSITGQPNAMGGREVGGLANMLAAHMNIETKQHRDWVQDFWQSPTMCHTSGLKAVDLFEAIGSGRVKAVWIMATNPVVSLPNRNAIEQALASCECVVVSECFTQNDTLAYADIILPASTWGEKNGTVTNSERCISRQRGLIAPPGQAQHDWQWLTQVAQAMGFTEGFNYTHPHGIFVEHARLSGWCNGDDYPRRDFDISGLAELTRAQYDALAPIQWPVNQEHPYGTQRMFADKRFFTETGKARFIPVTLQQHQEPADKAYPWILNSGRYRDQWHTMTRTGRSATLAANQTEPMLALAPKDIAELGLVEGDLAEVKSPYGKILMPFTEAKGQREGTCFAPIHWTAQTAPSANVARCYSPRKDAISGQPDSKYVRVSIAPVTPTQHWQIFSRHEISLDLPYWAKLPVAESGIGYVAVSIEAVEPVSFMNTLSSDGEWVHLSNQPKGQFSAVLLKDGQIQMMVFGQPNKELVPWPWLSSLGQAGISAKEAIGVLLLRDVPLEFSQGQTICSCFKVGENTITSHLSQHPNATLEDLGKALQCGTNCGSCRPELKQIIERVQAPKVSLEHIIHTTNTLV